MKTIVMRTDLGNGRQMSELYVVEDGVCPEKYAKDLIKKYNETIVSPFDCPRKVVSAGEASVKDCLDAMFVGQEFSFTDACWISPYGHVFNVGHMGHQDFEDELLSRDYMEPFDIERLESAGWVRVSRSDFTGELAVQCLDNLKTRQVMAIEKMLETVPSRLVEGAEIRCHNYVFWREEGKIRSKRFTRGMQG